MNTTNNNQYPFGDIVRKHHLESEGNAPKVPNNHNNHRGEAPKTPNNSKNVGIPNNASKGIKPVKTGQKYYDTNSSIKRASQRKSSKRKARAASVIAAVILGLAVVMGSCSRSKNIDTSRLDAISENETAMDTLSLSKSQVDTLLSNINSLENSEHLSREELLGATNDYLSIARSILTAKVAEAYNRATNNNIPAEKFGFFLETPNPSSPDSKYEYYVGLIDDKQVNYIDNRVNYGESSIVNKHICNTDIPAIQDYVDAKTNGLANPEQLNVAYISLCDFADNSITFGPVNGFESYEIVFPDEKDNQTSKQETDQKDDTQKGDKDILSH